MKKREDVTVQKAVTVKRKHIEKADEMAYLLDREDKLTGETNFSGVVRDAIEYLFDELNPKKNDRDES